MEPTEAEERLKCQYCPNERTFKEKKGLNRHIREIHPEKVENPLPLLKCPRQGCSYTSRSSACLASHRRSHQEDIIFTCEFCDMNFKSRKALKSHKGRQHQVFSMGGQPFMCGTLVWKSQEEVLCGKVFQSQAELTRHIRECHRPEGDQTHKCSKCWKVFKTATSLRSHQDNVDCAAKQTAGNAPKVAVDDYTKCAACCELIPARHMDTHFKYCAARPSTTDESSRSIFASAGDGDGHDGEYSACNLCRQDTSLRDKRLADWDRWKREVGTHGTRCFVVLPCPENLLEACPEGQMSISQVRGLVDKLDPNAGTSLKKGAARGRGPAGAGVEDAHFSMLFIKSRVVTDNWLEEMARDQEQSNDLYTAQ